MRKFIYVETLYDGEILVNVDNISYINIEEKYLATNDEARFELSEEDCNNLLHELERR